MSPRKSLMFRVIVYPGSISTRFVNLDMKTPMMHPPDLWEWIFSKIINHLLHSVAFSIPNRLILLDKSPDTVAIWDFEKPNRAESRPFQQGHRVDS